MKESIVLLLKTGKATAKVLTLVAMVHLCLFYMNNPFHQVSMSQVVVKFISDLISFCKTPNYAPNMPRRVFNPQFELDPSFKKDFPILVMVEVAYVLVLYLIFFLIIFSMIVISTVFDAARPPIKTIYGIFTICYIVVAAMLATPMVIYNTNSTLTMAVIFGIVAFVFYIYLWVVWVLGVGISKTCCVKLFDQVEWLQLAFINFAYIFTCGIVVTVSKIIVFANMQWMNCSMDGLSAAIALCLVEYVIVVASIMLYLEAKEIRDEQGRLPVSALPR